MCSSDLLKFEQAGTDSHSSNFNAGTVVRTGDSDLKEGWFGEAVSLTYRGLSRSSFYLGLDMEQRRLLWDEIYDAGSHEAVTDFGSRNVYPKYAAHINMIDFIPRVKFAHRLNSRMRFNFDYRWRSKYRDYNIKEDTSLGAYPGYLVGEQERNIHQVTTKLDLRLIETWLSTLKYQLITDNIEFPKVGGGQQDMDRHRFSLAFSGPVGKKLFAIATGTYEYYRLDTPTSVGGSNRWSPGRDAYDFSGDFFHLTLNASYPLTKKIDVNGGYRLTNSLGDNDNTLNRISLGFELDLNDTTSFEAGYEVFRFRDGRPIGAFGDDYSGQGMSFTLKKTLG